MEKVMLVLSVFSTLAAVVSAIIAVISKNEAKSILKEIKANKSKSHIKNNGDNSGVIVGNNMGDINNAK